MNAGAAADERALTHVDMTRQEHLVGQNNAIPHLTVVRDVRGGHQETVGADGRRCSRLGGTIDGDVFAQHRAIPNHDTRLGLRLEAQILWVTPDHGKRVHDNAIAEDAMPGDECMGVNDAISAETCTVFDDRGRVNAHAGSPPSTATGHYRNASLRPRGGCRWPRALR